MSIVHSIKYAIGLSNVKASRKLPSMTRDYVTHMPTFEKYLRRHNLHANFTPLEKNSADKFIAQMNISKLEYKHVSEIPEYAVKHNTGDAVYIPVKKNILSIPVSRDRVGIFNTLVKFIRENNY